MSWMKRLIRSKRLCQVCKENKLPDEPAVIRLKVKDGTADVKICDDCADFFDKSAEVLTTRGKGTKSDESV